MAHSACGFPMTGSVDWDVSRHYNHGSIAMLNPGAPRWQNRLVGQIGKLIDDYGFDGVFLDISAAWINDPHHHYFVGLVELCRRIREHRPDVYIAGEGWFDAAGIARPLTQSGHTDGIMQYHDEPAGQFYEKYNRCFGHLCLGDPSRGSTGVHELGYNPAQTRTPLRKGVIPTLTIVKDSIEKASDKVLEAINDAKEYARRFLYNDIQYYEEVLKMVEKTIKMVLALSMLLTSYVILPSASIHAAAQTLAKSVYYDKTLAGIIGEVGGFLSGYEFAANNPNPFPDSWFDVATNGLPNGIANGPYAGNFNNFQPADMPDYNRLLAPGRVRGQDNYFMDFFNQLIISDKGIMPSDADIRSEYLYYGISDYGGSGVADNLIEKAGMMPFQTGQNEFNDTAWCCEPYIETDTLGFIAPGMAQTAQELSDRFASVSGTFDTTIWSHFMAVLMSDAYFTNDARTALAQASLTLPHNSWPYQIYQKVVSLYGQDPTNWRWAQNQLINYRRWLYGSADDRVVADINQGTMMIAILYGNNDYVQTLKIASIGGNEGADNATAIGGLMGVINGMAGTPQEFFNQVDPAKNGSGVFVNDTSGNLQTYVLRNYPAEQTWSSLASLYQSNFEKVLLANGGSLDSTNYTVPIQTMQTPHTISIDNSDFEQGNLNGWTLSVPANGKAESQLGVADAYTHFTLSHSGSWKGTIFTDTNVHDVSLYRTISGLTIGATYRAQTYAESMLNANANFYVQNGSSTLNASAYSTEDMGSSGTLVRGRTYVQRNIEFTATGTSVVVGLRLQSNNNVWANFDDVTIEQINGVVATRYEAENAVLSGGDSIMTEASASNGQYVGGLGTVGSAAQFTVSVPSAGEYKFAVNYDSTAVPENYNLYGSNTWALPGSLNLYVNGVNLGKVFFPHTGFAGAFSANIIPIPVSLNAGSNTIMLKRDVGSGSIDLDYADLSGKNLLINPGVESEGPTQTPSGWNTWPGNNGQNADADYTETGSHSGSYRLTHFKSSTYEVYTSQTISNLTNGLYTASAWVVGGGGQIAAYMDVKNFGGLTLQQNIPQSGWPNWTQITIPNINVTNGQATIGFYSNANGGNWLSIDDVKCTLQ